MADAQDQKPVRDAFEDAQRPARFEEVKWTAKADGAERVREADATVDDYLKITMENVDRTDESDLAPGRESVADSVDQQPEGDGILSSLSTFEEARVGDETTDAASTADTGDLTGIVDGPPSLDCYQRITWTAKDEPLEEAPLVGEGDDDGSIMFET